jgi:hypothetical protein
MGAAGHGCYQCEGTTSLGPTIATGTGARPVVVAAGGRCWESGRRNRYPSIQALTGGNFMDATARRRGGSGGGSEATGRRCALVAGGEAGQRRDSMCGGWKRQAPVRCEEAVKQRWISGL